MLQSISANRLGTDSPGSSAWSDYGIQGRYKPLPSDTIGHPSPVLKVGEQPQGSSDYSHFQIQKLLENGNIYYSTRPVVCTETQSRLLVGLR